MCALPELLYVSSLAVAAIGVGVAIVYESRFITRLKTQHPLVWLELGTRKLSFVENDMHLAAAQMFLFKGEYRDLRDEHLNRSGRRAKVFGAIFLLALLLWAFVTNTHQGS
jgi:hypothetical protein